MKAKRRRHDPQFKARVALEALTGLKTVQQIAKDFEVHPMQVSAWKTQRLERIGSLFEAGREQAGQEGFERERTALHSKIGELSVQVDYFLLRASR